MQADYYEQALPATYVAALMLGYEHLLVAWLE